MDSPQLLKRLKLKTIAAICRLFHTDARARYQRDVSACPRKRHHGVATSNPLKVLVVRYGRRSCDSPSHLADWDACMKVEGFSDGAFDYIACPPERLETERILRLALRQNLRARPRFSQCRMSVRLEFRHRALEREHRPHVPVWLPDLSRLAAAEHCCAYRLRGTLKSCFHSWL